MPMACWSVCTRRDPMRLWPNVYILAGSVVLVMFSVAVLCVPQAPPTPEPADAGQLRAPESIPKRGGVLKWGGLANSTLYDLHQTGTIANMGPQAPMYDLLVQVDPVHWDQVIPDLAKSWTISEDGLTYTFLGVSHLLHMAFFTGLYDSRRQPYVVPPRRQRRTCLQLAVLPHGAESRSGAWQRGK